jgi:hypothetical protein
VFNRKGLAESLDGGGGIVKQKKEKKKKMNGRKKGRVGE